MKSCIRSFLNIKILLSLFFIIGFGFAFAQTASILPLAETQFLDNNGDPITNGTVDFYIPGTTTRKTTWQDSAKTVPNTNPVVLDAAGRALIYGYGSYRQVVKDENGNLIWDQVTNSYSFPNGGSSTGDGLLVGSVLPWSGLVAPNQYVFAYGQELLRSSFPDFFNAITITQTVNCTIGSPIVTGIGDTSQTPIGAKIELSCVSGGIGTVINKTSTTYTLNLNSIVTSTVSAITFPFGDGNGSTTFNVPDLRGYVMAGRDNMGGIAANRLTSNYFANASAIGATGGSQNHVLTQAELSVNLGTANSVVTDPGHTHSVTYEGATAGGVNQRFATGLNHNSDVTETTTSATTGITVATTITNSLGGNAHSIVQPTITLNYIIKVLPDISNLVATGVMSLGGMTGAIACGTNLICTANNISFDGSTFFAGATALVGLTPIDGTSDHAMRADAAPALNQSITPTWTGLHLFTATLISRATDTTVYNPSGNISQQPFDVFKIYNNDSTIGNQATVFYQGGAGATGRFGFVRANSSVGKFIWQLRNGGATMPEAMNLAADGTLTVANIQASRRNFGAGSFSVADYGADPTGVIPAVTAFQNAINAAIAFNNATTITTSMTTTLNSNTATVTSTTGLSIGMYVINGNLNSPTTITNISGTTLTLSRPATASNTNSTNFSWNKDIYIQVPSGIYAGDFSTLSYTSGGITADRIILQNLGPVVYSSGISPPTDKMFSAFYDGNSRFMPALIGSVAFLKDSDLLPNNDQFGSPNIRIVRNMNIPAVSGNTSSTIQIDNTTGSNGVTSFTGTQVGFDLNVARHVNATIGTGSQADLTGLSINVDDYGVTTGVAGAVRLGIDIETGDWTGNPSSTSGPLNTMEATIQAYGDDDTAVPSRKVMFFAIKNLCGHDGGLHPSCSGPAFAGSALTISNQNSSVSGEAWFYRGVWVSPKTTNGGVQTAFEADDPTVSGLTIAETDPAVIPSIADIFIKRTAAQAVIRLQRSVAGAGGNLLGQLLFVGQNTSSGFISYGRIRSNSINQTAGSESGNLQFGTYDSGGGAVTTRMTLTSGLIVGSATGGVSGDMGSGTINVATNIYKNGTAYNNPDYAFEKYYTGKIIKFASHNGAKEYNQRLGKHRLLPIKDLEAYTKSHLRLPGINDKPTGIFDMADIALENIEQLYLYQFEASKKIEQLEKEIDKLKRLH